MKKESDKSVMITQDIAQYRLSHQQIAKTKFKAPSQVVSWLGALQAQDYAGAKWSIGLRLPDATEPDIEQATPHEPFRLIRAGQEFVMQAKIRGDWKTLYRFDLQEQLVSDYEVSNWYVSTHPDSIFVTGLMAARPAQDRRYALRNNEFVVHHLNGSTDRHILTSVTEMRETLERAFRITVPDAPEIDAALARLMSQTG